jgi:hypothetical protein
MSIKTLENTCNTGLLSDTNLAFILTLHFNNYLSQNIQLIIIVAIFGNSG